MINSYRTEPLDYNTVLNNIVNGTKKYLLDNHIETMVLGISGGIDSTLTAAICKIVSDATKIPLIGISLPCSTNEGEEISSAAQCGQEFCSEFVEINLQDTFETVEKFCSDCSNIQSTPISQGNIKARLRMITLYDIASKRHGIVIDTDNLTECALGFFTIHGDHGDFNPIGELWKHEVYRLAQFIKDKYFKDSLALESAINITPTDGNGVKSGGDLSQIAEGKTYDDVDEILHRWVNLDNRIKKDIINKDFDDDALNGLIQKHGKDAVKQVILRNIKSEFKRRHMPVTIDIYRGLLCEKNGKILEI